MKPSQKGSSTRMLLSIDQSIIEGYGQALTQSLDHLADLVKQVEALRKQADNDRLMSMQEACLYLGKGEESLRYYRKFGLEP